MPKILVFIPSYRCEKQISRVLAQFSEKIQSQIDTVIVVDNQSPDQTLDAAIESGKKIMRDCNFIALRNNNNYGLGGSHKVAFRYGIENGFEYLIVLHGDDQADIRDIAPYLESGRYQNYDCFLGARFMKASRLQGYSRFRTFGNHVYNKLFSLVALRNIHDLGSGLNMYSLKTYDSFYYKCFPDDLTFNYVMLLASYHRKQTVGFFPITWREEDQVSNVRLFRQASKVLGLLAKYSLGRGKFLASEMRTQPHDSYSSTPVFSNNPVKGD